MQRTRPVSGISLLVLLLAACDTPAPSVSGSSSAEMQTVDDDTSLRSLSEPEAQRDPIERRPEDTAPVGVCEFEGESFDVAADDLSSQLCMRLVAANWNALETAGVDPLRTVAAAQALADKLATDDAASNQDLAWTTCETLVEEILTHEENILGDDGVISCLRGEIVPPAEDLDVLSAGGIEVTLDNLTVAMNNAQLTLGSELPGCWVKATLTGTAANNPANGLLADIYSLTRFDAPTVPIYEDGEGHELPGVVVGLSYRVEDAMLERHEALLDAETTEEFEAAFADDELFPVCVDTLTHAQRWNVRGLERMKDTLIDPPDELSVMRLGAFVETYAESTEPLGDALEDQSLEDLDGDGQVGSTGAVGDPMPAAADPSEVEQRVRSVAVEASPEMMAATELGGVAQDEELFEGGVPCLVISLESRDLPDILTRSEGAHPVNAAAVLSYTLADRSTISEFLTKKDDRLRVNAGEAQMDSPFSFGLHPWRPTSTARRLHEDPCE